VFISGEFLGFLVSAITRDFSILLHNSPANLHKSLPETQRWTHNIPFGFGLDSSATHKSLSATAFD